MNALYVLFALVALAAILYFALYNSLIRSRNAVDQSLSSVDVMLKKRFDLIPNLVATVERYMAHERDLLNELTALRAKATSGGQDLSAEERMALDRQVSGTLGRLMVAVEAYPDLKASQSFLQLQGALNEVEEQLSAARRAYNAAATDYHNAIQTVPGNLIAASMGLARRPLFEASEAERGNVDVGALFGRSS
jgi:LemA protein